MADEVFLKSFAPEADTNGTRGVMKRFSGLDHSGADGGFTDARNVEITPNGTVRAASLPKKLSFGISGKPLGFYAHGNYLYIAVNKGKNNGKNNVDLLRLDENGIDARVNLSNTASDAPRSFTAYSKWTGGSDIVDGVYEDILLIYPDKKAVSLTGAWGTVGLIARYDVTRTVKTKTLTTEKTYNEGKWTQNEDGTYTLLSYDGIRRDVDTDETSEFYASYANDAVPKNVTHPKKLSTVYTKYDVHNPEGEKVSTALIVTEKAVTVTESFTSEAVTDAIPDASLITTHGARLFGTDGAKIFASGAGSHVDYELDTAENFDEANAWYSATAGEAFTALTVFDGRVTAFKPNGLYQLYNTKNPFRVREISKVGTAFGKTVCETENVLYFANGAGIFAFNGAYPRCISHARLDESRFIGDTACAGAYDGKYYFRRETDFDEAFPSMGGKPVFVYDSRTDAWSILDYAESELSYIGAAGGTLYSLCEDGALYRHEGELRERTAWFFETPVDCMDTADVKRLVRLQAVFRFRSAAKVKISVILDNGDVLECGSLSRGAGVHPLYMPVLCGDHVAKRIRVEGCGDAELLTLEQILRAGGARYGS